MAIKTGENLTAVERVLVLGLGNILLKDEGVGVHIAQRLQKQELGDNIEVIDGGTASLDVLLSKQSPYKLVIIDAVRAGGKAGTIYKARVKGDETGKLTKIFNPDEDLKISSHQFGLIDALAAAEKMGRSPEEIVIIGVEPKEVDYGLEPTEEVGEKFAEIIETVLEEF